MFKIVGIDHIVLKTHKLQAMLHFYCDILGGKVEKVNAQYHLTHLRVGEHMLDLIEVDDIAKDNTPNMDHFCLRISPFNTDALETYFAKHDIKILDKGARFGAFGIGQSIYIQDPQGNNVELKEASR